MARKRSSSILTPLPQPRNQHGANFSNVSDSVIILVDLLFRFDRFMVMDCIAAMDSDE